MKIWILLPAFNEEKSIPLIFPKIKKIFEERQLEYRIVAVEDGSTDRTLQNLRKMRKYYPLDIIEHKLNRGLGETERDGFEYIAERADDHDLIVRFDCDDTHQPKYILSLIDKLNQGYDVVNTSRFHPGGGQKGVGAYRAFISYAANMFMNILFNIPGVKDYSCGFRAYRARVIKDIIAIFGNGFLQLRGLGFTSTIETIIKLKLLGCRFAEVPFVLRYDKKASPSKMVSGLTTLGYIAMAILYHWPFGGWRFNYKRLAKCYNHSFDIAYRRYARVNNRRSTISQIGG